MSYLWWLVVDVVDTALCCAFRKQDRQRKLSIQPEDLDYPLGVDMVEGRE